MSETLTSHLLMSSPTPYLAATKHPFLTAAGNGTLSPALLGLFLSQDRIYAAHAYPRFVGHLLASVPFSSLHGPNSVAERKNQRVVQLLTYSLQNVVREVGFFGETAARFGLDVVGWKERKATRDYTAEMARIGAEGHLEDGLVFLWAMERVYLDAWRYVGSLAKFEESSAVASLVANWTNDEFVQFVDDLTDLVNSLDIEPGSESWLRARAIWARVIELEEAFWPVGGDELKLLRA